MEIDMNILDKAEEIRKLISELDELKANYYTEMVWDHILNCIETIEDSQEAIQYYCKTPFSEETGQKYLHVYGLYQALVVQQTATDKLIELIGVSEFWESKEFVELSFIRDLRNDMVGHPVNRRSHGFARLIRSYMYKGHQEYIMYNSTGSTKIEVDTNKIIKDQETCLDMQLEKIKERCTSIISEIL